MNWAWLGWLGGAAALAAAGFATALLPRRWAAAQGRRRTWSTARAAIASAGVSRDASPTRVAEAERLLRQAEAIAADRGGRAGARTATEYARRADDLWRAAASSQATSSQAAGNRAARGRAAGGRAARNRRRDSG